MNAALVNRLMLSVCALTAFGCTSLNNNSTLEAMQESMGSGGLAYVEGFIEYSGPQSRWVGPATFSLHIEARDPGEAKVSFRPDLWSRDGGPAPELREPVRKLGSTEKDGLSEKEAGSPSTALSANMPRSLALSSEQAREELAYLATAMQGPEQKFSGCLSPVKVRLIRADGGVLERQGCRSQSGWPKAAGDVVHSFLKATRS